MKKEKTLFFVLLIFGVLIFAFIKLKDKFFNDSNNENSKEDYESSFDLKTTNFSSETKNSQSQTAQKNNGSDSGDSDEDKDEESNNKEGEDGQVQEDSEDIECNKNCEGKAGEELNTCLIKCREELRNEVVQKSECDSKTGTEKDTCFLNKAKLNKDQSYCLKITDATLVDKCKKTVTELIFDSL